MFRDLILDYYNSFSWWRDAGAMGVEPIEVGWSSKAYYENCFLVLLLYIYIYKCIYTVYIIYIILFLM